MQEEVSAHTTIQGRSGAGWKGRQGIAPAMCTCACARLTPQQVPFNALPHETHEVSSGPPSSGV